MSRLETRGRRGWNVRELRHLALAFGIPLELFGLSRSTDEAEQVSLGTISGGGGEDVRRRRLLTGTAAAAVGSGLMPPPGQVAAQTTALEEVLFGRVTVVPLEARQVAAHLGAATSDLRATRYQQLARRLPGLLAHAIANRNEAPHDRVCQAHRHLAQAYNLASHLLLKVHDDAMAWVTADRAAHAAAVSADPVVIAESQRLVATVMRRTAHRDGAQALMLDAAHRLRDTTNLSDPTHKAVYGQLLAATAYTAALRDDRDTAWTLLREAADTVQRLGAHVTEQFNATELAVYRISLARVLGDYGTAVEYSRSVDLSAITAPERRARYWEDTALALLGRGRPEAAFDVLLRAEQETPQEVRYRPWAQQLTRELIAATTGSTRAHVRAFGERVGTM
jgi:hypothetical protein